MRHRYEQQNGSQMDLGWVTYEPHIGYTFLYSISQLPSPNLSSVTQLQLCHTLCLKNEWKMAYFFPPAALLDIIVLHSFSSKHFLQKCKYHFGTPCTISQAVLTFYLVFAFSRDPRSATIHSHYRMMSFV